MIFSISFTCPYTSRPIAFCFRAACDFGLWFYGRLRPCRADRHGKPSADRTYHNLLWYISAPLLCNGEGVSPLPLHRRLIYQAWRLGFAVRFWVCRRWVLCLLVPPFLRYAVWCLLLYRLQFRQVSFVRKWC